MLEKITSQAVNAINVKSTPGQRLTGTVQENKDVFDKLPELIVSSVNAVIDALQSVADGGSGADCINVTPISGAAGTTVQAVLETFKSMLDERYTKEDANDKLDKKADKTTVNQSIKDVKFTPQTGILKFIKQDGTSFEIDTLIEKITTNFSYDAKTQSLKFTASDGTIQTVPLSAFITQTEFSNTDSVSVSVSESGVVSFKINAAGITEEMLNSAIIDALVAYRDAAHASAAAAASSETNAGAYAESASKSATSAALSESVVSKNAAAAKLSEQESDRYAKLSQSYAVGGTNTRDGEDADNSRYYANLALQAKADAEKARDETVEAATGDYVVSSVFRSHAENESIHSECLLYTAVPVNAESWEPDESYNAFPYRAAIACDGVTQLHMVSVVFDAEEAASGNFAPVCESDVNVVYVFAAVKPEEPISVSIEARKIVEKNTVADVEEEE